LVIGANGAIGQAFVDAFQSDVRCIHVEFISRSSGNGFDLLAPDSIINQAERTRARGPFDIIIDATGALVINGAGPEKSLASLNQEQLVQSFQTNAIGPALVLQSFAPLLSKGPAIYAKLSARVGSISDNHKGGWYGYRASKAALNMLLQTAAIELQRKNKDLRVVAMQPGTVQSNLSKPFLGSSTHVLSPSESVFGMMNALKALKPKSGAYFVDYKGDEIPW
jgi:NAD(P)-dependent dehydrogenase (short-subunit alcohol dehydrogenase family)